jgi:tetratricopeptide (TPR) repeat protein
MNRTTENPGKRMLRGVTAVTLLLMMVSMLTALALPARAQGNQLSLADILIALRSKKVTLPERNKLLTEAVATRGTTFSLTPEIEKELGTTGADKALIDSIRQKSQFIQASVVLPSTVEAKLKTEPVAAPPPPDFAFYETRANANRSKGDLDAAVTDYSKAVEMNPADTSAFYSRGSVYLEQQQYDKAIADFDRVIELNPKGATAHQGRGAALEKKGNAELALAEYKEAVDLDPVYSLAKDDVARLEAAAAAKIVKKPEPVVTAAAPPPPPDIVDLGQIPSSLAVRMTKPTYSPIALNANLAGNVTVHIEIDKEGNVTSAKVVDGHPLLRQNCEYAALHSKFKPTMAGDQAVKAKGYIVYKFSGR